MKRTKNIITILTLCLIFVNCSSTKESGESDQPEGATASTEDTTAVASKSEPEPKPDNTQLLEEYADAKIGWFEMIGENEKLISGLKSAVLAEKDNIQSGLQKKLTVLEQLNNKQKTKIALYKPQKKENWDRFKKLVTSDLAQINEDLKALRKEVL